MTRRSKFNLNKIFSLSCDCMNLKKSDISNPKPRPSATKITRPEAEREDDTDVKIETASQLSQCHSYYESPRFGQMGGEGLAVEKDSNDPYIDFKHSMLQMIIENEIYSKEDLRELLNCFLQLNAPYHHGVIIKAFTDIWNGMFSVRSASPSVKRVRRKARQGTVVYA